MVGDQVLLIGGYKVSLLEGRNIFHHEVTHSFLIRCVVKLLLQPVNLVFLIFVKSGSILQQVGIKIKRSIF